MSGERQRKYYVERMPRGFSNEIEVYAFPTKESRRKFLEDMDEGGRSTEPYPVSAKEARKDAGYRGDSVTRSYNTPIIPFEVRDDINPTQCESIGGEWVAPYRKQNGRIVHGYCRRLPERYEWEGSSGRIE